MTGWDARIRPCSRKETVAGLVFLIVVLILAAIFMHPQKELAQMERVDRGDYAAILWEGREYVPWGAVTGGRGEQIGYVDGDEKDKVYEYSGQSPARWIVNACDHDGAMLYREQNVLERPQGLDRSEYPWNP